MRVVKGVKPKAPQILFCHFNLKPCLVSMSIYYFYHRVCSVPVAPLKRDERSLEPRGGFCHPEAHFSPSFSNHGNIFQMGYHLFV